MISRERQSDSGIRRRPQTWIGRRRCGDALLLVSALGDYWAAEELAGTHLPSTRTSPSGHALDGAGFSFGALEDAASGALDEAFSADALDEAFSVGALDDTAAGAVDELTASEALEDGLGAAELLGAAAGAEDDAGSTEALELMAAGAELLELATAGADDDSETGADDAALDGASDDTVEAGALEALMLADDAGSLAETDELPDGWLAEVEELPDGALAETLADALADTSPEADADAVPSCWAA